jgi:hypothetical protein
MESPALPDAWDSYIPDKLCPTNVIVCSYDKVHIVVKTRHQVVWSLATGGSETYANEHQ